MVQVQLFGGDSGARGGVWRLARQRQRMPGLALGHMEPVHAQVPYQVSLVGGSEVLVARQVG